MFTIPVGDLLESYSGDSKSFSFSGEVYDGLMEDIHFLKPLTFSIDITALDNGVSVLFHDLATEVEYEWAKHTIHISAFDREYKSNLDPLMDPDDIRPIEKWMIDLTPILREEIIMATYSL